MYLNKMQNSNELIFKGAVSTDNSSSANLPKKSPKKPTSIDESEELLVSVNILLHLFEFFLL